jgi:hypothetical protein
MQKLTQNGGRCLLDNHQLSELLARQAEKAHPPANKALRRAARRAYMWEEEAARIVEEGRSLTELPAVGPYIAKLIYRWLEEPPVVPVPPNIRRHFLTLTAARKELARNPSLLGEIAATFECTHTGATVPVRSKRWRKRRGTAATNTSQLQTIRKD